jgi:hypothetical protein
MQNCVDEILLTSRFFPNERKCIVPSVLGAGVQLFETGPLIPMSEDEYVAAAVAKDGRWNGTETNSASRRQRGLPSIIHVRP